MSGKGYYGISSAVTEVKTFGLLNVDSILGLVEFDMALDVEDQAHISQQKQFVPSDVRVSADNDLEAQEAPRDTDDIEKLPATPKLAVPSLDLNPLLREDFIFPPQNTSIPRHRPERSKGQGENTLGHDIEPTKMKKCSSEAPGCAYSCTRETATPERSYYSNHRKYHRRDHSEAESYTTHWDKTILLNKDTNIKRPIRKSGLNYASPYLGPIGWTVPSRYSSTTRPATTSGKSSCTKTTYQRRGSKPFLIYQDPEWYEPPAWAVNIRDDAAASDDKENNYMVNEISSHNRVSQNDHEEGGQLSV